MKQGAPLLFSSHAVVQFEIIFAIVLTKINVKKVFKVLHDKQEKLRNAIIDYSCQV